jgi:spermidine synthase
MYALHTIRPIGRRLVLALLVVLAVPFISVSSIHAQQAPSVAAAGKLEFDGHSDFSHIRVRRNGALRSMLFVRDTGEEVLESQIDLRRPQQLQFEYLRFMFSSYLFRSEQQHVLIVGLGGGGMIHFLQHIDPAIRIDAVEIDPEVVRLADKFFNVRTEKNVTIATADGLKFIADSKTPYDVIYMDAFLKPSAETDGTGAPLSLRTKQFYEQLQTKLRPGGVVVFNLNPHPGLIDDIRGIQGAFPQTYVFPLTRFGGAVVVGSTTSERVELADLVSRGRELNRRFKTDLSFQEMAKRLYREN